MATLESDLRVEASPLSAEAPLSTLSMSSPHAAEDEMLLRKINTLLTRVGIPAKPITSFNEVKKSASSMFVAIFEGMFKVTREGIVRKPTQLQDYVRNAQVIIDALDKEILHINLDHVTGAAVARGDAQAIHNLVDIFFGISDMVLKFRQQDSRRGGSSPRSEPGRSQPRQQRPRSAPVQATAAATAAAKGGTSARAAAAAGVSWPAEGAAGPRLSKQALQMLADGGRRGAERDAQQQQRRQRVRARHGDAQPPADAGGELGVGSGGGERWLRRGGALHNASLPGPARLRQQLQQQMQRGVPSKEQLERQRRAQAIYRHVLKGRLAELRKKEVADITRQFYTLKNSVHASRVQEIRAAKTREGLEARAAQRRVRREQDELSGVYHKVLKTLHRHRLEDDREDAARLKALHDVTSAQAEDLEHFFLERMAMVKEVAHEERAARSATMRSERRGLARLLRAAAAAHEERLARAAAALERAEAVAAQQRAAQRRAVTDLLTAEGAAALRVNDGGAAAAGVTGEFKERLRRAGARATRGLAERRRERAARQLRTAYGGDAAA